MILRKGKSHLRQVSPGRPASDAQVHSGLWGATCPLPGPTSGDRCRYGRKEGEPAGRSDKGPRFGTWNPKLEPLAPSPWPQVPAWYPAALPHPSLRPARAVGSRAHPEVPSPSPARQDPHTSAAGPRLTVTLLSRDQRRRDHREQEPEGSGLGGRHAARGAAGTRGGCGTERLRGQTRCTAQRPTD